MDPDLQEMLDHHRIRRTLAEYCHGCDRCDERLMAGAYLEDSWDDHGHLKAPGPVFARQTIANILAVTTSLSHLLGQSLVVVDGDGAGAETYFIAAFFGTGPDGARTCSQLGGRYVDRLEREGSRWLIKQRVTIRDWSITLPVEQDFVAGEGLTLGSRCADDPSYAALGLRHRGHGEAAGNVA